MPCSGVSHAWVFSADSAGSCGCGLRASAWHPPTRPPDRQRANCMLSARVSWPSHRPFVPPRQLQSPSSREPQPWWPVASQMWLQLQACPTCATQTLSTPAQLKGDFRFWITAAWWQHSRGLCDPAGMQGRTTARGASGAQPGDGPPGGSGALPTLRSAPDLSVHIRDREAGLGSQRDLTPSSSMLTPMLHGWPALKSSCSQGC